MGIELSPKDRMFADLFFGGSDDCRGNAARCYKQLYPRCKDSTAETNGPRLLRKAQVQEYLESKARKQPSFISVVDGFIHKAELTIKLITAIGERQRGCVCIKCFNVIAW